MVSGVNQKIIGAIVVGGALVAGAYTLATFGVGKPLPAGAGGAVQAPARVAIKVEDKDQNGVEDWRDSFFMGNPTIVASAGANAPYASPNTQTGKVAISLIQDAIYAKNGGAIAKTKEQVVSDTVSALEADTEATLYDTRDVIIMETWTDADIKTYANTMGQIIINGKNPSSDNEIDVLKDVLQNQKQERIAELTQIAANYEMYRTETKGLPVPRVLLKEHLDLLNTYEALYQDVLAFSKTDTDPLLSLARLRRYPDDAVGISLAFTNMTRALKPYGHLFTTADPATIFSVFDPNYKQP